MHSLSIKDKFRKLYYFLSVGRERDTIHSQYSRRRIGTNSFLENAKRGPNCLLPVSRWP